MAKSCRKILGDDLTKRLEDAGILDKVETKINQLIDTHGVNALGQDAGTLGGKAGETGLEYLKREVIAEQVNDIKLAQKDSLIEGRNVVDMHNTILKDVAWFETNFPKNPIVKKSIKGDKSELISQIIQGKLMETNFKKGADLEKVTQSTFGEFWGNAVDKRLSDEIGPKWYVDFAKKKEDIVKVFDDLIAIQKNPTRNTSVNNSNTPHYKIARAIADSMERMVAQNNKLGGKMSMLNLLPKARLNAAKITNKNREQAVNDFMEMIDDAEITAKFSTTNADEIAQIKRSIAEDEINRTTNALPDKDAFGNIDSDDVKAFNRDYTIPKTGEAYYNILAKYSTQNDWVSMLYTNFNKLSEQHAMTKMFGARPLMFIGKLKKQLNTSDITKNADSTLGFERFEQGLRMKIESRPIKNTMFNSGMQIGRNLSMGKLGFVFVDQLIMEPVFSFFRLATRGNISIGKIFGNIGPLQGKQKRLAARYNAVAMESFVGAVNNRFFGSVYEAGGSITEATRRFANLFFKYTGSQLLSDGQAAAGFAVNRLDVTDALKTGKKWDLIKKERPEFALDLEQAGITATMWDNAMRGFKNGKFKGEDDLFDPIQMPTIDNTLKSRGQTDYDAWMAFFQKRVDSLSRMKPGELEQMRIRFYTKGEGLASVLKTLLQFKSFSFAVARRTYGDAYLKGGKVGVMKTAAGLAVPMFMAGLLSTQARYILKGGDDKQADDPLSWFGSPLQVSSDLISQAWARSGVSGLLAPVFDPLAEAGLKKLYGDRYDLKSDWEREVIGPSLGSMMNILEGGFELATEPFAKDSNMGKEVKNFAKDISAMVLPNGLGLSMFSKWLMYDVLEKNLAPEDYRKRQKFESKRRRNTKSKGAKNFSEWLNK